MRMTIPRGLREATLDQLPLGERAGRSWVLLFGPLCCSTIATATCARTHPAGRQHDLPSSTARVTRRAELRRGCL
jgi:hypothetical protein